MLPTLLTTYYLLLTTRHSLLLATSYYLPPTTYYLLPTTYYLLPTTYYLLPTTYYLLPTTYYFTSQVRFMLPTSDFQEAGEARVQLSLNGQQFDGGEPLSFQYHHAVQCTLM